MKNLFFITLAMCCLFQASGGASRLPEWIALFKTWIPLNSYYVNVMMLLDSSGSVGQNGFLNGKVAIEKLNFMIDDQTATGITGSPFGTRSGFIQFASMQDTVIKIHLNEYDNVVDLNAAIHAQVYTGGGTAIDKALWLAEKEFTIFCPNSWQKKRVLLVSDGIASQGKDPEAMAQILKNKGVEICTVSIGKNVNANKLKQIATKYGNKLKKTCYLNLPSWRAFKRVMRKALRLLRKDKKE